MADLDTVKRSLRDRLKDSYRVTIIDEENLEEMSSFRLSLLNFYSIISVAAILFASLLIAFIIFTPVKRLIPGYGDITDNKEFNALSKRVSELESELIGLDYYTNGLRNMLTGGIYNTSVDKIDSVEASKVIHANLIDSEDVDESKKTKELNFLKFVNPINGKISARFAPNIRHFGVDIIAPKDTPIKSVMDGIVISADNSLDMGNTIFIQHTKNLITAYKHNSALLVKTGDIVKAGQVIAIIGNTGEMSSGPHLHFEMWFNGFCINPENYISFN